MRTIEFVLVLAGLVLAALWVVREQDRRLALGYEEGRLTAERAQLRAVRLELRYQRERLASPAQIEAMAARHGLDLVPPAMSVPAAGPARPTPAPAPGRQPARVLVAREEGR